MAMTRLPLRLFVFLGAGLVAVSPVRSEEPADAGKKVLLRGRVTSAADGKALLGATVTVREWCLVVGERGVDAAPQKAFCVVEADADGAFEVPATGLDGPVITVAAKGHAPVTWREDRAPAAEARRDVVLPVAKALEGRVLRPDGSPAPRAHVFAVEYDALDLEDLLSPLAAAADLLWGSGQYDSGIAYRYAAAIAGDDGTFRIADADATKWYVIVAASADLGPSMIQGPVMPGLPLPDLRLDATAPVWVRVVTDKGEPLVVRKIELRGSPREVEWGVAEDGVYRVGPVGPGLHVLEIRTRGRGEVRHDFTLPRDAREFETTVIVGEGGTVSGVVTDIEGNPIVGATVQLRVWDRAAGESRTADTRTDADGKFAVKGQTSGPVNVYVSARGFQGAQFLDLEQPVTSLGVTLRRARTVQLQVLAPEGVPLGSLRVATRSLEGGPWVPGGAVVWSEEQIATFDAPVGRAAIRLWAPGCALHESEIVAEPGRGPMALDAVRLLPARTVKIRLVDEEGMPVPGLKVHAEFGKLPPVDWTAIQKTTDSDGLAVIDLHVEGAAVVHVEEGQGRERVRRAVAIPADQATVVDVIAGARKK